MYRAAFEIFGKKERKSEDWFEAGTKEMDAIVIIVPHIEYKKQPTEKTLIALHQAHNNAKWIIQKCTYDYWLNLCRTIQASADFGNFLPCTKAWRKALAINIAPLKYTSSNAITDRSSKLMETITRSCTLQRTLLPLQLLCTSLPCPPWMSSTHYRGAQKRHWLASLWQNSR